MVSRDQKIDSLTKGFKNEFGSLTKEQLNKKINTESWSIAQIIDHLIVTNKSYYPIADSLRQGTYKIPFIGRFNLLTNFFGNFILKSVQPDRKRKVKTFPVWEPSQSEITGDIIQRFEKHQAELKNFIADCSDLVQKDIVISSPANKNIVYKIDKAFEIIIAHEERHFVQAIEVKELILNQ
jgi:DinB superfamily